MRLHDGIEGGHLGRFKTLRKMQESFWRPGMSTAVTDYCKSCLVCAECKSGKRPRAPLTTMTSTSPMQRIHVDIVGPIPRSRKGNSYILTVQCSFTKWAEAYPLRNQTAKTCANKIVNEWIARYGVPDSLHSDQGRNFESNLFKEICDILDIKKTRTTAYHPAGNGQVENFNKTVKGLLQAKIDEDVTNTWDEHIGACMMAYRSSIHQSTGYTPFHLMFGREMRLPLDVMMGPPDVGEDSYGEFASQLKQNLNDAYRLARENLNCAQKRQKEYYDKGTKKSLFNPGDEVHLFNPHIKEGEAAKFHRKWKGPFKITAKITDVNYKLSSGYD
ncbi:Retrovirus-related Pol polyprotein from transposon 412 [Exaiptasia diaphana]|nr:Retrovirus-related Pol polyprotein from transposon 412 [Exaiptasia diaphana]